MHRICRREEDDKSTLYPLLYIPPRTNPAISGVHADACGPLLMSLSRASLDQDSPVITGMPPLHSIVEGLPLDGRLLPVASLTSLVAAKK